ncbi:hypothetical protein [Streptomyces longisporoflavus]|uniref:Uncharacterized protein n=1 Tax=Streptomyces longisporoflavus TaxID=28044 RepID=A0ABW7QIT6_9ACTN
MIATGVGPNRALDAVGSAVDALGERFTMNYATLAATAVRAAAS